VLSDALQGLTPSEDPNLLIGFETSDDAAVYRLSPEIAVISTVDFITPPVDDPYWFGQIAAANSLSDIYAMGGRPVTALNVVMFPAKKLDVNQLKEILRGGHDKVMEAGASMAGGHTVDDREPKYGLAVTGVVHPDNILTNCGSKEGDALILTKPLGTGVLFNACRSGKLSYHELEQVLSEIASLNDKALEISRNFKIHACTDITGFGILGHAFELAKGCGMEITLTCKSIPVYPNALRMYEKGETTGSNEPNRKLTEGYLNITAQLSRAEEELLFDPQTSGGLLFSVPSDRADSLIHELHKGGIPSAAMIGTVAAGNPAVKIN
jgi:selenide,water dikinase